MFHKLVYRWSQGHVCKGGVGAAGGGQAEEREKGNGADHRETAQGATQAPLALRELWRECHLPELSKVKGGVWTLESDGPWLSLGSSAKQLCDLG